MDRIIGDNSHGFNNENALCNKLNNSKLKNINGNLRLFIQKIINDKSLNTNENTIIKATVVSSNKFKQDLVISIENIDIYISVKMGTGNSVHQEKIDDFIDYLKNEFNDVSEELENTIKFFIWADGSIDGNAEIEYENDKKIVGRFGALAFSKQYPEKREDIQAYFDKHKEELMRRFLFIGKNNSKVDYIYYGTPSNGSWISSQDLIDFNIENPQDNKTINLGRMGIQSWNVSLSGNSDKKRGQLQVKYGKLENDLHDLLLESSNNKGTYIGNKSEFDISRTLNKNIHGKFWDVLIDSTNITDNNNIYVVKVTKKVFSNVSKRKVSPKSDAYLIKANIDSSLLFKHNHELTEDIINNENIEYDIIPNSGISVKRIDSKNFSIVKMGSNSFSTYFSNFFKNPSLYFCGALLYVTEPNINKNKVILQNLNINSQDLLELVGEDEFNLNTFKKIKDHCSTKITNTIKDNTDLKLALFTGKGVYDDPYYSNFITMNGILTDTTFYDFYVTSGSGRSNRKYTIILKPL